MVGIPLLDRRRRRLAAMLLAVDVDQLPKPLEGRKKRKGESSVRAIRQGPSSNRFASTSPAS